MATSYELMNGVASFAAYGDSADDVAKALLKKARKFSGEDGAATIMMRVGFSDGGYTGEVLVSI